jgi:hypothetical protein
MHASAQSGMKHALSSVCECLKQLDFDRAANVVVGWIFSTAEEFNSQLWKITAEEKKLPLLNDLLSVEFYSGVC